LPRSHKTELTRDKELSPIAFRTTLYQSVKALPADFDQWIMEYNTARHGSLNPFVKISPSNPNG
jgi:hypothetical protein